MNPDRSIPIVSTSGELAKPHLADAPAAVAPAQWEIDAKERRAKITATMESLGLTVESDFIPCSKSRNADKIGKDRNGKPSRDPSAGYSLNWKVRVFRASVRYSEATPDYKRLVIETDYSAGSGHCPADKAKASSFPEGGPDKAKAIAWECENGFRSRFAPWGISKASAGIDRATGKRREFPIMPDACDVLHSLVMDSDVLDSGSFEEWARDFGYDTDSRAAEFTYRACLEIGLKMRNGIGEAGLAALREAFQDY